MSDTFATSGSICWQFRPRLASIPYVISGNLLFLCGQGPLLPDGTAARGKVGRDVDLEEAKRRARLTGVVMIAVMREAIGDLDRVVRIVKLLGMVNGVPDLRITRRL